MTKLSDKERYEIDESYKEDALYIKDETTIDDIMDYLRECVENPVIIDDTIIWNFSTHKVDLDGLKLDSYDQDEFIIPYQVSGTWGFIFSLLPDRIKEAELLIYHQDVREYRAYKSFYRISVKERREQLAQDLSRRMESEVGGDA